VSDLKHPCAQTRSGYQQGFEAGAEQMRTRAAEAVKEHVASIRAHDLKNPTKCAPCLTAELVLALPLSPEEPKS
jgi:hypothetical protein